ncbi:MAG: hypothetical protein ABI277_07475 [Burkholderiaceae bacterium]
MNQRPLILSAIVGKLCSVLLCGLLAAWSGQGAEAGEAHPRRLNGYRNGQLDARNARQVERVQQRPQQRAAQREPNAQRVPETTQPVTPPAYQAAEPAQQRANGPGRMTRDERRALRQQINEVGRDVYRPTRP